MGEAIERAYSMNIAKSHSVAVELLSSLDLIE